MKIFNGFSQIRGNIKNPIITWGVFDGVHSGHQELIHSVIQWAKRINTSSLVITFRNHPEKVLNAHKDPLFITSLTHRLMLLQELSVPEAPRPEKYSGSGRPASGVKADNCLVLNFTRRLSQLSADGFIQNLISLLNPTGVVVTDNISFGRNREGNIETLRKYNIPLKIIHPLKYGGKIISSSLIRSVIRSGNLKTARRLLGRRVSILGTVIHGEGRGKTLGFPTANLDPHNEILPPRGVYIAIARCLYPDEVSSLTTGDYLKALVNIGIRPTFHRDLSSHLPACRSLGAGGKDNIEVYLLGYDQRKCGALYGKDILVEIISRLRDEERFITPEALVKQIRQDIEKLRRIKLP
ncbi:MAG: bifunctional riboflavin kinase/FMN adenylyltransferase [Planctomycetota bacterium]|nr:bifunctional riboflavin kinase/FMN adenylyltransferase [Planctomycetota bacterium]MDI6787871.1 bifunctional riboflavin kinase/FMN adenylyltransferase [Planctomycetota bacterium]